MENLTIIIRWKDPFTHKEVLKSEDGNGLYLLAGIQKHKQLNEIQYCGITEGKFRTRLNENTHHKLPKIWRELNIWLGEIQYPLEHTRTHLEVAETVIVYFWQPDLNNRKKFRLPRPTTLISQWYKKDGSPRVRQHSLSKDLPDVLSWDGHHWRTGNLSVYED
ncbi:hypothetical protein [Methylophilus sp. 5]|uniref:hypothetical protein n=1 Tax=Methylophilus sp. 5 TaxID=1112274 RepID=UPI00048A80CE|nr:hypothetical protein [Methylophilus sp. 5]